MKQKKCTYAQRYDTGGVGGVKGQSIRMWRQDTKSYSSAPNGIFLPLVFFEHKAHKLSYRNSHLLKKTVLFGNTRITGGFNCTVLWIPDCWLTLGCQHIQEEPVLEELPIMQKCSCCFSISVQGMHLSDITPDYGTVKDTRALPGKKPGKPGLSKYTFPSAWRKFKKPVDYLAKRSSRVTPNKTANFLINCFPIIRSFICKYQVLMRIFIVALQQCHENTHTPPVLISTNQVVFFLFRW